MHMYDDYFAEQLKHNIESTMHNNPKTNIAV